MEVIKTNPEPLIIPRNGKDPKVVIRPMLTTAQKNFRTVKDCPTIESCHRLSMVVLFASGYYEGGA